MVFAGTAAILIVGRASSHNLDDGDETPGTAMTEVGSAQSEISDRLNATTARPLVVDLDGTLLRSDLLYEDATSYLLSRPAGLIDLAASLRAGIAVLKETAATVTDFDPAILPYDERVVAWLQEERSAGRWIVLATATVSSRAKAIAAHLALFDEVLATEDGVNLRSTRKADLLVERYGEGGFDYVGNHRDDFAVWSRAGGAHVVGASPRFVERVRTIAPVGQVFPQDGSTAWAWLEALRPHQWLKNLLVFVPLLTAQDFGHPNLVLRALLSFVAMSLTASSVYLLNDMADISADRHHPTKRNRPFASGRVSLLTGWMAWPILLAGGIGVSLALPFRTTLTLLVYLAITLVYTFRLKREPVIDVICLAGLYTIRLVVGGAAAAVPLSIWLLTCSIFLFTSLAVVKRVSELTRLRTSAGAAKGRGYTHEDLELMTILGVASGYGSVIVFALYVNDPATSALYQTPHLLWLAVPVVLYWVSRLWLLGARGAVNEDPLLFAAQDRVSLLTLIALAAVFVAAKFL
jgi:4-hydroxybenzoate polyprenyltransferase/phosphoserine phosphatase